VDSVGVLQHHPRRIKATVIDSVHCQRAEDERFYPLVAQLACSFEVALVDLSRTRVVTKVVVGERAVCFGDEYEVFVP
jgi:hypothetical protein